MSDETFDFDDTTPDGMKSLRKAYEKMQTQLKEERENSVKLATKQRARDLQDKLVELGAKPKLAGLVPATVEVESIGVWLTENADLFGWKPNENEHPEPAANAEEAAAAQRISGFSADLPGDDSDNPDLKALLTAGDARAIADLVYARQAGIK